MNKLLVVEDHLQISSGEYIIDAKNNPNIKIDGKVLLHEYETSQDAYQIEIEKNSHLSWYQVCEVEKNMTIHISLDHQSILDYHVLFINHGEHTVTITIDLMGSDVKANIHLRAINLNSASKLDVICNGKVYENTMNNELLEDLKGLILNHDTIKISPNMFVDTNEVMANHFVTIGSFDEADLFYLKSKGISLEQAKRMLLNAFVMNGLSDVLKEKLNHKMEVITIE